MTSQKAKALAICNIKHKKSVVKLGALEGYSCPIPPVTPSILQVSIIRIYATLSKTLPDTCQTH